MVLHNPNNWHWVNKDVSEWTKEYLNANLPKIEAHQESTHARVLSVTSMDGDVDVSQRKGKVITLFDVKLVLDFEGSTKVDGKHDEEADAEADGVKNVTGTINIPEVAHDTEEDEYVFDISVHGSGTAEDSVKQLVKQKIVPQLRKALSKLAPALVEEHGKDIQHAPGQGPPTGYITSKTTSSSASQTLAKGTSTSNASAKSEGPVVNTVAVTSTAEFRTSAAELFVTFTDPQRIAAFTRSPPSVFEGAKPGGKFALFGGGVQGEYVSLKEPTQIVQKWRLSLWPQGHYSTLTLDFNQDDSNHVTNMRAHWDKVPVGEEDNTKAKWGEYYERSLKTTFGFGTIL